MTGMQFGAFLTLLILGLIAASIMQFAIRYRALGSVDGFFAKWIAGWIGAWLGSPVLGHWAFHIQNVYVIPGIIGAFVGAFSFVALARSIGASALKSKVTTMPAPAGTVSEAVRKAS
jgi:uncharacterized membrane protein YeaQ/YmgE (transglycosylase-associated protein family)